MYRVTNLSNTEIRKIGDAYADYTYSEGEVGMTLAYKDRQAVSDYICGFVRAMIKNGCLYTTSPGHEGYIAYYPSWKMMKPAAIAELLRTFRSTLGIKGTRNLIEKLSAAGESYEDSLKKAKKKYIFVALVAVPEEHQGKGHMRKLLEFALEQGRENNCPVILDTDDALKKAKYEHLGMKTVRTRKIADNSFMYDLVWEPDGSPEAVRQEYFKAIGNETKEICMHEYGDPSDPLIVLLAPMLLSGQDTISTIYAMRAVTTICSHSHQSSRRNCIWNTAARILI